MGNLINVPHTFKWAFSYHCGFPLHFPQELLHRAKVRVSISLQALATLRRKASFSLTVGTHS